jgi:hypothetical protein
MNLALMTGNDAEHFGPWGRIDIDDADEMRCCRGIRAQ